MTEMPLRSKLVGFYAPMKSPEHAVASGDRQMARYFVQALQCAGAEVRLLSSLRCFLGDQGDTALVHLMPLAEAEVSRLREEFKHQAKPDILFAYHVYHKSPDLIAAPLSREFGIPYVIAEASYAAKQRHGIYDRGLALSVESIGMADLVIQLNPDDLVALDNLCGGAVVEIKPFMDLTLFSQAKQGNNQCVFITHAMMRGGDKLRSYELIARAFRAFLSVSDWRLVIIGGGEAEVQTRHFFTDFGHRVSFIGLQNQTEIGRLLAMGDVYIWPGINEAYGMGLLEAVACGLPVISGKRSGIATIVSDAHGGLLCKEGDVAALQTAIASLLDDYRCGGNFIRQAGDYNWRKAREQHDIAKAAINIGHALQNLIRTKPHTPQ